MGLFAKILGKLGIRSAHAEPAPTPTPVSPPAAAAAAAVPPVPPVSPAPPAPISLVDVESRLEQLAAEAAQKLNWRTSIVDLLKLLDIDSSHAARRELAVELGCPPEKLHDSAAMNVWLHRTVLRKIAENGGRVPKELLD